MSKRLFGSYSHSEIPGFPFRLFCSQEQNSQNIFRNIFLFRNIDPKRTRPYMAASRLTYELHTLAKRSRGEETGAEAPNVSLLAGLFFTPTFSKQGLILRQMLMRICRTLFSSNLARIFASPDIASNVISSSKSSLSSIPAIMADKIVVEYFSS